MVGQEGLFLSSQGRAALTCAEWTCVMHGGSVGKRCSVYLSMAVCLCGPGMYSCLVGRPCGEDACLSVCVGVCMHIGGCPCVGVYIHACVWVCMFV